MTTCDGSHLKALINVLDRTAAATLAVRQSQTANPHKQYPLLTRALAQLQEEHAKTKHAVRHCSECSAIWAALVAADEVT